MVVVLNRELFYDQFSTQVSMYSYIASFEYGRKLPVPNFVQVRAGYCI